MGIASFVLRAGTAFSIFVLVGCVSDVTATRLNAPPRPLSKQDPSKVEVLRERVPLDGYIEIYSLEIDGGAMIAEDIRAMREKAGRIGCEKLVLTEEKYGPRNMTQARLRGTCLVAR